ncbi:hypothetical protein N9L31_00120 [bacterium]|nr:hypothetical protein [bacterium]
MAHRSELINRKMTKQRKADGRTHSTRAPWALLAQHNAFYFSHQAPGTATKMVLWGFIETHTPIESQIAPVASELHNAPKGYIAAAVAASVGAKPAARKTHHHEAVLSIPSI